MEYSKYLEYPFVTRHRNKILPKISKEQRGLEIGPYDKPWILKQDFDVLYMDRFNRDELVKNVNPNRDPERIVDLDFVVDGITEIDEVFDYILGVHVFEHMPNPVGFLNAAYDRLVPGGKLFLVIPDANYTFDILRPRSTLSDYLDAFLTERTMPSVKSVFESSYWACGPINHHDVWKDSTYVKKLKPSANSRAALDKSSLAASTYIDCHVSIISSGELERILLELSNLNVLNFSKFVVNDTERGANDFLVVFER